MYKYTSNPPLAIVAMKTFRASYLALADVILESLLSSRHHEIRDEEYVMLIIICVCMFPHLDVQLKIKMDLIS